MPKNLEIEFLEFLEPEDGIPKDVDNTGYYGYYDDALGPIWHKWVYEIESKSFRYWFDTLNPHVFAKIKDHGINHLYEYRINNILIETNISTKATNQSIIITNKSITDTNKNITFNATGNINQLRYNRKELL